MIMSFTLDESGLRSLLKGAVEKQANRLNDEFRNTLNSPLFSWNSTTYRRNGEVVTDPRNAIDTRKLLESAGVHRVNDYRFQIIWDVDYSANVLGNHADVDLVKYTIRNMP
jgi:hypothetical protein